MKWITLLILTFAATSVTAQENSSTRFHVALESTLPTFFGLQAGVTLNNSHTVYLGLGRIPPGFASAIGRGAARLGENSAYQDLAEAALQDNGTLKLGYRYSINSSWSTYFHFQGVRGSGRGEISKVLEASTGVEYPNMTDALINAGKDPRVDIEDELQTLEIGMGYNLPVAKQMSFQFNAGLMRVYSAEIQMATGLGNFDNSSIGQATLEQAEEDTEEILVEYGWVPTLGVAFHFEF